MTNNKENPIKILLGCNANRERSMMLENALKAQARDRGLSRIEFDSAGTSGIDGKYTDEELKAKFPWKPPQGYVDICAKGGIDISEHESKMATDEMAREADFILVPEQRVQDRLEGHCESARGKTQRILEYAAGEEESKLVEGLHPLALELPDAYYGDYRLDDEGNVKRNYLSDREGRPISLEGEVVTPRDREGNVAELTADPIENREGVIYTYRGLPVDSEEAYLAECDRMKRLASMILDRLETEYQTKGE